MKKYKDIFIKYIKAHCDEFKYKVKYGDYGNSYIFILPSPNKFLGIFPINFKFTIYLHPEDIAFNVSQHRLVIDINTSFWKGVRLNYEDDKELILLLSKIFQKVYKEHIRNRRAQQFYELSDLTKEK